MLHCLLGVCTPKLGSGSPLMSFLSPSSPVCAHLHRPVSEWLWRDVHDFHLTDGKSLSLRSLSLPQSPCELEGTFIRVQFLASHSLSSPGRLGVTKPGRPVGKSEGAELGPSSALAQLRG